MTQSDKDPFWQPPTDNFAKLPDFEELFQRFMCRHRMGNMVPGESIRIPDRVRTSNADQNKLRNFLKNLDDDDQTMPDYYDYDVEYEEWCQVYDRLKDAITENDSVKKLLNVIEEMERWRAKYPSYAHKYWEKNYGKNK